MPNSEEEVYDTAIFVDKADGHEILPLKDAPLQVLVSMARGGDKSALRALEERFRMSPEEEKALEDEVVRRVIETLSSKKRVE